jgi:hypothetical protein
MRKELDCIYQRLNTLDTHLSGAKHIVSFLMEYVRLTSEELAQNSRQDPAEQDPEHTFDPD